MRRQSIDWLIAGPDPYLANCERCGQYEEKPPLPMEIDAVLAYMKYVTAKHRLCKPKGGRPSSE